MDNTIIAVIIGGLLTGSGSWTAMWLQHKKWKIEQKIRTLENKRDRLEALVNKTLENLSNCMKENAYSTEILSDIDILFPQDVSKIFNDFMSKKEKTEQDRKFAFYDIAREMKKSISDIENEIEKLLK